MSDSKRPMLVLNKAGAVSNLQDSVKRLSVNPLESKGVSAGPSMKLSNEKKSKQKQPLTVAVPEQAKKPELNLPNCPPARLQLQKLQAAGMPRPLFS